MNLLDVKPGDLAGLVLNAVDEPRIHIVDDDASVRTAVARLLGAERYAVSTFDSAESFLSQDDHDVHGCIILDIAMPGLDGLALQQVLQERGNHMPVIFLTGQIDVPLCVSAMKNGALDFLMKPVDDTVLLSTVARALKDDKARRAMRAQRMAIESLLSTLTAREREVLNHVMAGRLNKQIAADLGKAEKTIKVHRARGMEKMHVRSVAELVRMVDRVHPTPTAVDNVL